MEQQVRVCYTASQRLGKRGPRVQGTRRSHPMPKGKTGTYLLRLAHFAATHKEYNIRIPMKGGRIDVSRLLIPA